MPRRLLYQNIIDLHTDTLCIYEWNEEDVGILNLLVYNLSCYDTFQNHTSFIGDARQSSTFEDKDVNM